MQYKSINDIHNMQYTIEIIVFLINITRTIELNIRNTKHTL